MTQKEFLDNLAGVFKLADNMTGGLGFGTNDLRKEIEKTRKTLLALLHRDEVKRVARPLLFTSSGQRFYDPRTKAYLEDDDDDD